MLEDKEMKYMFKNIKHSVTMKLVSKNADGSWTLEHETYKGLLYQVKNPQEELVEVEEWPKQKRSG